MKITPQTANSAKALKEIGDNAVLRCDDWSFIVDKVDLHIFYSSVKQSLHDIWISIPKKIFNKAIREDNPGYYAGIFDIDFEPNGSLSILLNSKCYIVLNIPKKLSKQLVKWYTQGA